jgi:hypothetical protein
MFIPTGFGALPGFSLFPAADITAGVSSVVLGFFFISAYMSPVIGPTTK